MGSSDPDRRPPHGAARAPMETRWTALAAGVTLPAPGPGEAGPPRGEGAPARLGRFVVERELGRGGMGQVLEALDPDIGRRVAIKLMLDPADGAGAQDRRFVVEARLTGQLEHPGIVPVHEVGVTREGRLFFVMKKVEGRTLGHALGALARGEAPARERFSRFRLLSAFVQVCQAVGYAHRRGVLHRDLKPENVMLGEYGEVLVLDWGIARVLADPAPEEVRREAVAEAKVARITRTLTMDGIVIGTPGYMSPEQIGGDLGRLDARSDVFSLGAILYEVLTWEPAYPGRGGYIEALVATVSGPPADPRHVVARARTRAAAEAAPEPLPDEIADVCLRALSADREARFPSAVELGGAVEAFLEGARRREEAARRVAEGETTWKEYLALALEGAALVERDRALAGALPSWATLEEKRDLLAVRARLGEIAPRRAELFGETVALWEKALSHDPSYAPARAALARSYWERLEEAEERRDPADAVYFARRVAAYDDGAYAPLLRGTGAVTLRTDPPGAVVRCARFERKGLVWPLVEERVLGTTPLEEVPLEMGSYVLTIRAPGKRDTIYPVHLPRGRHWDSGVRPVPLYAEREIGEGFVYVPPGPCVAGGDPEAPGALPRSEPWVDGFFLAVFPVTMAEYCEFLNALHEQDPEAAWRRVPRQESGIKATGGQYWERPSTGGRYAVPEVDRDGDSWDARWALMGVSWDDAAAYAAWRAAANGTGDRLPHEIEWEKAARGVDGRSFPWGHDRDAALCKMRDSRPGRPVPEPVGAFPSDVSVYGVRDLAGGVRDWCGDPTFDGDPLRRPVRGGSWASTPRSCRLACRLGHEPWLVSSYNGVRLLRAARSARGPRTE